MAPREIPIFVTAAFMMDEFTETEGGKAGEGRRKVNDVEV